MTHKLFKKAYNAIDRDVDKIRRAADRRNPNRLNKTAIYKGKFPGRIK